MNDDTRRMAELTMSGYGCSQILLILALESEGRSDPDLVRAVSGLHGGVGQTGKLCGALTGGACALGLRLGRAEPREQENARLTPLVEMLAGWFEAEQGARFGGVDCAAIAGTDPRLRMQRCPGIVLAVHRKVQELLALEAR